jgi:hypothetical protein
VSRAILLTLRCGTGLTSVGVSSPA